MPESVLQPAPVNTKSRGWRATKSRKALITGCPSQVDLLQPGGARRAVRQSQHEAEAIHIRAEIEVAFGGPRRRGVEEFLRGRAVTQALPHRADIEALAAQPAAQDLRAQVIFGAAFLRYLAHAHDAHALGLERFDVGTV